MGLIRWIGCFFFLIWIRCYPRLLEDGESAFEVGYVVVGIVSYKVFLNSLGLALRDVKDLLCRRDAYMGAVWKAERCFIKI